MLNILFVIFSFIELKIFSFTQNKSENKYAIINILSLNQVNYKCVNYGCEIMTLGELCKWHTALY